MGIYKASAFERGCLVPVSLGGDVLAEGESGTGKSTLLSMWSMQAVNIVVRRFEIVYLWGSGEVALEGDKLL